MPIIIRVMKVRINWVYFKLVKIIPFRIRAKLQTIKEIILIWIPFQINYQCQILINKWLLELKIIKKSKLKKK